MPPLLRGCHPQNEKGVSCLLKTRLSSCRFVHFVPSYCCKTVCLACINKTMIWISVRDLQNLFPSKLHAVIFVAYMGLFINQGKM